jgi:hypothetical protein
MILSILELMTALSLPTKEKPISALWYMSLDPTSATDALKLLRSLLIIDLTTLRFPFKERHSCNLKVIIPIPTTIGVIGYLLSAILDLQHDLKTPADSE